VYRVAGSGKDQTLQVARCAYLMVEDYLARKELQRFSLYGWSAVTYATN
jgi:hypothetical protein